MCGQDAACGVGSASCADTHPGVIDKSLGRVARMQDGRLRTDLNIAMSSRPICDAQSAVAAPRVRKAPRGMSFQPGAKLTIGRQLLCVDARLVTTHGNNGEGSPRLGSLERARLLHQTATRVPWLV
jgi:hypothetical protein